MSNPANPLPVPPMLVPSAALVDPRSGLPTVEAFRLIKALLDKIAELEQRLAAGAL